MPPATGAPRGTARHAPTRSRRAFTIVEVLLVIVVLALLAAITVPRLVGMERRQALLAVDRLQEMMSTFAYRDSLGVQRVAVWRDPEAGSVKLLVKEFNPEDPEASATWRPDRFVQPVRLPPDVEIVDVRIDDRRVNLNEWMIESLPNTDRPRFEMDIEGPDLTVTLMLDPHMIAPVRFEAGKAAPRIRTPQDLDAQGLDRGTW